MSYNSLNKWVINKKGNVDYSLDTPLWISSTFMGRVIVLKGSVVGNY